MDLKLGNKKFQQKYFYIGLLFITMILIFFQIFSFSELNKGAKNKLNTDANNAISSIRNDLKIEISFKIGINPSSINWETDDINNINILWSNLQKVKPDKIQKIIASRLEENDIKEKFEYRIIGSSIFNTINSPGYTSAMIGESYQKALTYDGSYTLYLFIANKDKITSKNIAANAIFLVLIIIISGLLIYMLWIDFTTIKNSNETKIDFINNMTHELKTPLSTISLAVDFLQSPAIMNNPEKIKEVTAIIKSENVRMTKQVEKILEAAQFDIQDLELKKVPLNVNKLLGRYVTNFKHQLVGQNETIEFIPEAKNDLIMADEVHFTNILNNLLDNAYKYSKPGYIKIRVKTSNPNPNILRIQIKDEGIGMKKDIVKQVFDKFYRAPTGNLHGVKGFGLGLSYVKAVIDSHKAEIYVKSTPNAGSSFVILFPLDEKT